MEEDTEDIVQPKTHDQKNLSIWNLEVDEEVIFPAKYGSVMSQISALNRLTPKSFKVIKYSRRCKREGLVDAQMTITRIK